MGRQMRAFDVLRPHAPALFRAWFVATLVAAVAIAAIALTGAWRQLVQTGPYSDLHVTLLAVALAWIYCGTSLWALRLDEADALVVGGACVTGLLYVNLLRERQAYGDLIDYVGAAFNLYHGAPLPPRYLYAPLWATMLRGVVPFGAQAAFDFCWTLNAVAVPVLFVLLVFALRRYDWTVSTALAAAAACLVVNVPVLRTLFYGQINLHVVNLLLAGLLAYPRSRVLSACLFAFAAHLKLSPLVLAAPFLLVDRKWGAWWLVWLVVLAGPTLLANGTAPFHDTIFNLRHVYDANGLTYRDTSIDALVHSIAALAGRPAAGAAVIAAVKALVVAWGLFVAWRMCLSGDSSRAAVIRCQWCSTRCRRY